MSTLSKKPFGPNIFDVVISLFVFALSLSSVWVLYNHNSGGSKRAMIYQDGNLIREYDLSQKGDEHFEYNNTTVEINNGKIRIEKNNCPRGICAHSGWISQSPETIVCIPKKLLIEVVESQNKQRFNAVSY